MLPIISNEFTKTQIKVIANNTVNDIIDGGKDVLKIADTLAKLELFIKELKANPEYMDYLIHEVSQYGKGTTTSTGTKLELAEVDEETGETNTLYPPSKTSKSSVKCTITK